MLLNTEATRLGLNIDFCVATKALVGGFEAIPGFSLRKKNYALESSPEMKT